MKSKIKYFENEQMAESYYANNLNKKVNNTIFFIETEKYYIIETTMNYKKLETVYKKISENFAHIAEISDFFPSDDKFLIKRLLTYFTDGYYCDSLEDSNNHYALTIDIDEDFIYLYFKIAKADIEDNPQLKISSKTKLINSIKISNLHLESSIAKKQNEKLIELIQLIPLKNILIGDMSYNFNWQSSTQCVLFVQRKFWDYQLDCWSFVCERKIALLDIKKKKISLFYRR